MPDDILDILEINATNVISFEKKKHKLRGCQHRKLTVNEGEAMVTCAECGEKIDPMWLITRMANNEATLLKKLHSQYVRLCNIEIAIRKKTRAKCKHCGKFNDVKIDMKEREWLGWNKI